MTRRAAVGLIGALATFMVAPLAHAEMALRWDAPPACPQRAEVLERIRALAGASLDKTEGLSVEGSIERSGSHYALTLLVRDEHELRKRVITSQSCADLAGAAAVTLALLLGIDVNADALGAGTSGAAATNPGGDNGKNDPSNGAAAAREGEGKQAGPEGKKVSAAPAPPDTSEASRASRPWGLVVRAPVGHADYGPLPKLSLGLGLGAGVRYEAWRFLLTGHWSRKQTVHAPEPNGDAGAELARWTGEMVACRGWGSDVVEVAPCAAVALEHVSAQGFGNGVVQQSASSTWPALGAGGVGYWYPWKSLAIFASVTGYVELSWPRIVIEGVGEVTELLPVGAHAAVGAEWIF